MLRIVYKQIKAYALVSTINNVLDKFNYFELNAG